MITSLTFHLLVLMGQIVADPAAAAQDAAAEKGSFKQWVEFYTQQAAEYEVSIGRTADGGNVERRLELQTKPVLQYSNPVRPTDQHGTVYVWTCDGRPEAIGSMWSSLDPDDARQRVISHEFQSLSLDPIVSKHAKRTGRKGLVPDWKTSDAGIELKLLPDAAAAAKTAPARLAQMRRLADEFSAKIVVSDVEAAGDLRLLTQPLLRYSSESAGVVDGGLFAYVLATDPELLLLIELRETKEGPRWHYAAARFTNRPLELMRGSREVWSCPKAEAYVGRNPYFLYWGVGRHSSDFE